MSFPTPTRHIRAVVFDLDDTLAPSKSPMDPSMSQALDDLLERIDVCIISGGAFEQFEKQAIAGLTASPAALDRLYLMPTCGTRYYRWVEGTWTLQYAEDLTEDEKSRAIAVLEEGARALGHWQDTPWGEKIEDRGSQITFSALGQEAPVAEKAAWDIDGSKKRALWAYATPRLPDLEVRGGGSTSIDVTRKGIDKAYGVRRLIDQLDTRADELLFIGDRLDETGNDYPVFAMGVPSIDVEGWRDTLGVVRTLVKWLDDTSQPFPLEPMSPSPLHVA